MYTGSMKIVRDDSGKLVKKPKFNAPLHKSYTGGEVKIRFGIVKCKFLTPYPTDLFNLMTVMVPGYFFTPSYKNHMWDGKHHFITNAGYFHTGLLPVVYAALKTGEHPLDKDGHKKVIKPVENVTVIVPEELAQFYHPGLENYYLNDEDTLQYLNPETGDFAYPTKLLHNWVEAKGHNPLATRVLKLAKRLHFASKANPLRESQD